MYKLGGLLMLAILTCLPAQALSGRGSFVFAAVVKSAALRPAQCPGKLGNQHTRCALSGDSKAAVQARLSRYKGWKKTDPWKAGSAGFTNDGTDQYLVTVMNKIGSKHGTLIIFSEL